MISTQPGSTPLSSFKIVSLEDEGPRSSVHGNDIGPYGDQDDEQVGGEGPEGIHSPIILRTKHSTFTVRQICFILWLLTT